MVEVPSDAVHSRHVPVAYCRPRLNNFPSGHEISLVVENCPLCGEQHVHPGGLARRPFYTVRSAPCCGQFIPSCAYRLAPAGGAA